MLKRFIKGLPPPTVTKNKTSVNKNYWCGNLGKERNKCFSKNYLSWTSLVIQSNANASLKRASNGSTDDCFGTFSDEQINVYGGYCPCDETSQCECNGYYNCINAGSNTTIFLGDGNSSITYYLYSVVNQGSNNTPCLIAYPMIFYQVLLYASYDKGLTQEQLIIKFMAWYWGSKANADGITYQVSTSIPDGYTSYCDATNTPIPSTTNHTYEIENGGANGCFPKPNLYGKAMTYTPCPGYSNNEYWTPVTLNEPYGFTNCKVCHDPSD